ncbi:MAG: SIS domain-containing protein [archaeon]|nr:SIS domain-containing protein [archaeon]
MDDIKRAEEILKIQQEAIKNLKISPEIIQSIERIKTIKENRGRIITTGMGKAGIIASKMSATLSSIGLPSYYVSSAEAAHGDIGRIAPEDLIIVFSNSGNTKEVLTMISQLHVLNGKTNYIITITGNKNPKIPTDLIVHYGKLTESCIVSKVPSTSTTIMLMIADILAITAAESIGFNDEWFKNRHPGGAIGTSYQKEDDN